MPSECRWNRSMRRSDPGSSIGSRNETNGERLAAGRDPGGELGDRARGRDPTDPAPVVLGEPQVLVGPRGDAQGAGRRGEPAELVFDTVGGAITNNTVTDIEQGSTGTSGCQEGNAIEVRNAPFTKGAPKPRGRDEHEGAVV